MSTFRTPLPPLRSVHTISHSDPILLMGSCFTEHIGQRLVARHFQAHTNPFGIVYNPASIARGLERLTADNQSFTSENLFAHAGLWHSWEHHGHFSGPEPTTVLSHLNHQLDTTRQWAGRSTRLLLTLGTSDVFALRTTGQIVANNHKMPSDHFYKKRCI